MKVAVTGAAGFIGKAVLRRLREAGHSCLAVTRRAGEGGDLVIPDLADTPIPASALAGVSAVIHLAGASAVPDRADASQTREWITNVEGTKAVARAAVRAGVKRIVFVSSIKAMREASLPGAALAAEASAEPTSAYGKSKLAAEHGVMAACENTATAWTIVRPPLVYGIGSGGNFALLVRLVQSGVPLPFGAVANSRTLIHVDNLADLLVLACFDPALAGQVALPGDATLSTPDLLAAIAAACGKRVSLIKVPLAALHGLAAVVGQSERFRRLTDSLAIAGGSSVPGDWTPPLPFADALARSLACIPSGSTTALPIAD